MATGRKADLNYLAGIIIAIIASVIFLVFVIMPTTTGISSDFGDSFCHLNAAIRNAMIVGTKVVVPLIMCHERTVKVDAKNWNECDPDNTLGIKDAQNRQMCAAVQLAKLGNRCFTLYGRNTYTMGLNYGSYQCFNANVVNLLGGSRIDANTLAAAMSYLGYCKTAFNAQNCGSGQSVVFGSDFVVGQNSMKFCDTSITVGGSETDYISVNNGYKYSSVGSQMC